ncbi:helix-turn-helix transcriptional regulator [Solemya velum gill symbiont]|uniref:helix-turn-helix transcriptional regulator n=1 Tax=Solemya velum gill symbiont TaxID=2340 RepID=UPI0015C3F37A|nr:WYL domain-containing protein [Solemya velum gill symbiont]
MRDTVYDALLEGTRFEIDYASREQGKISRITVSPYGIVARQGIIYLVGTLWDYTDFRHLALHRMSNPASLDETVAERDDFELATYLESNQSFGYPRSHKTIKLKAVFDEEAAFHLHESPLSDDQRLIHQKDDRVRLEATVMDTEDIRWWLLGFGDMVEVLSPKSLRNEFKEIAHGMAIRYRD